MANVYINRKNDTSNEPFFACWPRQQRLCIHYVELISATYQPRIYLCNKRDHQLLILPIIQINERDRLLCIQKTVDFVSRVLSDRQHFASRIQRETTPNLYVWQANPESICHKILNLKRFHKTIIPLVSRWFEGGRQAVCPAISSNLRERHRDTGVSEGITGGGTPPTLLKLQSKAENITTYMRVVVCSFAFKITSL